MQREPEYDAPASIFLIENPLARSYFIFLLVHINQALLSLVEEALLLLRGARDQLLVTQPPKQTGEKRCIFNIIKTYREKALKYQELVRERERIARERDETLKQITLWDILRTIPESDRPRIYALGLSEPLDLKAALPKLKVLILSKDGTEALLLQSNDVHGYRPSRLPTIRFKVFAEKLIWLTLGHKLRAPEVLVRQARELGIKRVVLDDYRHSREGTTPWRWTPPIFDSIVLVPKDQALPLKSARHWSSDREEWIHKNYPWLESWGE